MMTAPLPHVVILGGGFAGITAARVFRKAAVRVTLIDRQNHHLFQPLLYQVATAALNPGDIASPIRRILRGCKNVEVLLAEARSIDVPNRVVELEDGSIDFDYLIIATGATHSYFGHDEWAKDAPGLKTIEDALGIRRRVLFAFEAAERETDPGRRASWLTFVVVGGGPTGVELAGAVNEIARHALARDFRHIDPTQARVVLIEGSSRILHTYPAELSKKAQTQLERLGVEVHAGGGHVTTIDAEGVVLEQTRIPARTVLWAAGVGASPLSRSLGAPLDRVGKVMVNPDLTIPGSTVVYVVGDLAHVDQDGKPVPGVAPAAIQMADRAARNVLETIRGEPRGHFHYKDKGSLATIGRAAGVADFGWIQLSGWPAWLAWLFVHLFFLIGFRNRFLVLFQWGWSYVTYDRGARLITGLTHRPWVVPPLPAPRPKPPRETPAAAPRPGGG